MTTIVVAIATTTLFIDQQRVHINQGAAWAADSIAVKLHPEMFSSDPAQALGLDLAAPAHTAEQQSRPVEQATAAPGEKSNTRRPFGRRS